MLTDSIELRSNPVDVDIAGLLRVSQSITLYLMTLPIVDALLPESSFGLDPTVPEWPQKTLYN